MSDSPACPASPAVPVRRPLPYVLIAGVLCFAAAAVAIGWPVVHDHGFPLDDSWIHQVVGRNAARYGIPGFTPDVASSGSSSTLWPWLIALNYRFLPAIAPEVYLFALNLACLAATLFCLYGAARRDRLGTAETLALVALPALYGNFVWLLAAGMEHLLFIAALFLAAHCFVSADDVAHEAGHDAKRARSMLAAGTLFGIGILTRPEALALLPCFAVAGLLADLRRRDALLFAAPCAVAILLVLTDNLITSHALLPVTLDGRKWLYFGAVHPGRVWLAFRLVHDALMHVTESITGFGVRHYWPAALPLLAATCAGIVRLVRRRAFHTLFLFVLAAANFATYAAFLPALGHAMRYEAMSLVFVFPLLALGLLEIGDAVMRRRRATPAAQRSLTAVLMLACFALAFGTLCNWSQITDAGIRHINGTHVRMGKWLDRHLPPDATVASFDIGAIGYFSHRRIADLGGLVDPAFIPYLYANRSAAYLRDAHIDWLVLPTDAPALGADPADDCAGLAAALHLCDSRTLSRHEIVAFYTPLATWRRGFLATGHALDGQVLYRLTWR